MGYAAAVIGAGGMGGAHCRQLERTDGIELRAIADADPDVLTSVGDRHDLPTDRRYDSHETLLRSESLDLVCVATPTLYHAEHVTDAARLADPGVVFCEKPIATSVSAGESMVACCADAGIELVVNHSRRWTESFDRLHRLIGEDQVLGEIRSVQATWKNELVRNGTHLVDMVLSVLDGNPVGVSGQFTDFDEFDPAVAETLDDGAAGGFVTFDDGTFVSIDLTLPRDIHARTLTLVGADGWMHIALRSGDWRYWARTGDGHVERELASTATGWSDRTDALENAFQNVVGILDGREDNLSPGPAAVDTLEVLVGLAVSSETDSHVSLPLSRPLRSVEVRTW